MSLNLKDLDCMSFYFGCFSNTLVFESTKWESYQESSWATVQSLTGQGGKASASNGSVIREHLS